MKATRIVILVMVSSLLALLTTTEAINVWDYDTGKPIRLYEGCYISAVVKEENLFVGKMEGSPYVGLQRQPSRSKRYIKLFSPTQKSPYYYINTDSSYFPRFNDSKLLWEHLPLTNRIAETSVRYKQGGHFLFGEDEQHNRLWKINYQFGETVNEVGVHVSNQNNGEDIYYLGLMESGESHIQKDSTMMRIRFKIYKAL